MFGKSVVFQMVDGPHLMIPVTSFLGNYARVVFLIFCQIVFLGVLGCVCGALLSTPVAIFLAFSYVGIGAVLLAMEPASPEDAIIPRSPLMYALYLVRQGAGYLIVSVNEFNQLSLLSKGQLIELGLILAIVLKVVVLRGLPMAIIGNWLLRRRELGLVIRR